MIAPITLIRIQGNGIPKNLDKVITPNKIDIAGAIVKIVVDTITFLTFDVSIPISLARRSARTRKKMDSIHYEPYGVYAGKTTDLNQLPEGATIAVPNRSEERRVGKEC